MQFPLPNFLTKSLLFIYFLGHYFLRCLCVCLNASKKFQHFQSIFTKFIFKSQVLARHFHVQILGEKSKKTYTKLFVDSFEQFVFDWIFIDIFYIEINFQDFCKVSIDSLFVLEVVFEFEKNISIFRVRIRGTSSFVVGFSSNEPGE